MEFQGLRKFSLLHTGAEGSFEIEHRLFNQVSFFGSIVGLAAVIINVAIGSVWYLTLGSFFVGLVCAIIFYLSRFKHLFNLGRWILTPFLFVMFTVIFFINNGSQGPLLYLYMVFSTLIIFIWDLRGRIFFIILFILNITAFYYIEFNYPDLIDPYPSKEIRLADIYFSYFLYIGLVGMMLNFAKTSYIRERRKAERADHLKSAFLANMSHEIRTPMNAILGFTQLLDKDLPKEKHDAYLNLVKNNGESLLRLIEDIIDISKIEAGELSFVESYCDLNQVVSEVEATTIQSLDTFPGKKVIVVKQLPEEAWQISTDRTRLRQVLMNLASNAVKFTDNGSITIGYDLIGNYVRFYVKDTGIGIKKEHQEEIFDRFRKIDEGRVYNHSGTGIGLSICRNLIRMMGGTIGVQSEKGVGSEFFFIIPLKEGRVLQSREVLATPAVELTEAEHPEKDLSGFRILIAEDEQANFLFLQRVLEPFGVSVIHARDGKEAVEIFQQDHKIDLVLMDIMMPVMDGLEATAAIKKIRSHVPIVAQTALAMQGDEEKVLGAGCDDYLSKPIRVNELIAMISGHLIKS